MSWARRNLFGSWWETLATLLILWLAWKLVPPFIDWTFLDAVWRPDSKACRAGEGACWGFIAEKWRFILFGTYPYELHWRPAVATVLLIGLWLFSAIRRFWRPWLTLVWLAGMRWPIESAIRECKSELGMDQYEVRGWTGWHHHTTMTLLAHHFLVRLRRHLGQRADALTLPQARVLLQASLPRRQLDAETEAWERLTTAVRLVLRMA